MHVVADLLVRREERAVELPEGARGFDLLKALGLAPDAHLLLRGETPIPHDEPLREGERVRVLTVVSGGSR